MCKIGQTSTLQKILFSSEVLVPSGGDDLDLAQTGGAPLGGYRLYMNTGRDAGGPRRTHRNGDFGDDGPMGFTISMGILVVNPSMTW